MRKSAIGIALSLALLAPLCAQAQRQGGNTRGGAPPSGSRGAAAPRAVVAPRAPARPSAVRQPSGGFNLNRDLNASAQRPSQPVVVAHPPEAVVRRPPANDNAMRPPANPPNEYRPPANAGRPPVIVRRPINVVRGHTIFINPAHRGERAWAWNRGVPWEAAPTYWGGGFWGPFTLGAAAIVLGVATYGAFDDLGAGRVFSSYRVAPDSPGANLLANYRLTQTPCGAPDLVVIFGPDDSPICAYPNNLVGPGEYELDSSNLTLVSR